MYKLMVALRYMRRNWLNIVGVAAVALGVLVLSVVLSVMKGFDEEFRARIHATLSDLIIENWSDEAFDNYEALMAQIEKVEHVKACAPRYEGFALLTLRRKLADGSYGQGLTRRQGQFIGIDLERELKATDFADYVRAWRGKEAREALASIFSQGDIGLAATDKERILHILNHLRAEDFDSMESVVRKRVTSWTKQNGVSLQSAFETAAAMPITWGEVPNSKVSPSFAGSGLLVIGQTENGDPVSMGTGDMVVIYSATDNFSNQTFRQCQVNGEFRSGMSEYDVSNIYLPLADTQWFMSSEGKVTSINIRLDSFKNAPVVRATLLGILTPEELRHGADILRKLGGNSYSQLQEIETDLDRLAKNNVNWLAIGNYRAVSIAQSLGDRISGALEQFNKPGSVTSGASEFQELVRQRKSGRLGGEKSTTLLRVSTWEDKGQQMLRALMLERKIMGIILFFVILVAGFLILSIVHTTVLLKIRDIGILKSIGGTVGGVMSIFLFNGMLMGTIGSALGVLGGHLITKNIDAIQGVLEKMVGYSLFPKDIYYLDKIPVDQHPFWSTAAICLSALIVSLLASAYPAWKASRMSAVEALRFE